MSDAAPDLFLMLGGREGCVKLATLFYAEVESDPVLRPLFGKKFLEPIRKLSAYLSQLAGGPPEHSRTRWYLSLREAHRRFAIGPAERDAWLAAMGRALDKAGLPEPARGALRAFFERSAPTMVNRGGERLAGDPLPEQIPGTVHGQLAARWKQELAVEEVVAAVRRGDAGRALALVEASELRELFDRDQAALASLLVLMMTSGDEALLDHVMRRLRQDPGLVRVTYFGGRTLLHGAAAAGYLPAVELLLDLGASVGAADGSGRTPLFGVANECRGASGSAVARALLRSGAVVDARDRVKRCTPLHAAARRGSIAVAAVLLDWGADLEARDVAGDTPLRRAVNCGQVDMATFLRARGGDAGSRGARGLTPLQAARTDAMRRALEDDLRTT
ncbi:MAG: ankyrin repeat domain-containing protein [Candidatus Dormibacteraeota bacterium]|nr:ankyrin repeat domain-containing protein [Candidatus Dormibacteraeota bacterium]